jgi:hypothetical protein
VAAAGSRSAVMAAAPLAQPSGVLLVYAWRHA